MGAIGTAAEAGSTFGFQLIWVILLGTMCVIFLVEMSGRLAAVSKHTLADAVRERFGFNFYVIPLFAEIAVDFLVLAAEIGGVCIALQLLTSISFQWWALPVAFAIWLLLWKGTFGVIENSVSLLGLITLVFVVARSRIETLRDQQKQRSKPKQPPPASANSKAVIIYNLREENKRLRTEIDGLRKINESLTGKQLVQNPHFGAMYVSSSQHTYNAVAEAFNSFKQLFKVAVRLGIDLSRISRGALTTPLRVRLGGVNVGKKPNGGCKKLNDAFN